jgi:SPP1 family phage portal protein
MINDIYTTDYTAETLTSAVIATFIRRHATQDLPHLKTLYDYYCGNQAILDRVKDEKLSNERLVINHAAYIADFTSGYLLGTPVSYSDASDKSDPPVIQPILDANREDLGVKAEINV